MGLLYRYAGSIYREAHMHYCLTLKQPWLYCILRLDKRIENRRWYPPVHIIGKRLMLHAGKQIDQAGVDYLTKQGIELPNEFETGAILGSCVVTKVVTESTDPCFQGPYGWVLKNVEILDEPIPASGKQRLWKVTL